MKKSFILLAMLSFVLTGCGGADDNQVRSFDGVQISFDVQGKGETALVFVHGWSCSSQYWNKQTAHFAKTHTVVTIDLAGHGQSGSTRRNYTIEAFGADVAAVLQKLDLNRIILVGHSMGGPVIVEAATQMPERVICVVGADTFHDIEKGYGGPELEEIAVRFEADFVNETQNFVRQMFPPFAEPELIDWIADNMSSADPQIAVNAFRNLGKYDLKSAAEKLEIPIYSISTDLWPTNVEVNQNLVKSFKLKMMPGTGHFVMLEDAEKFNELLEEIIKEL